MKSSMKENIDIRYNKVWIRNKEQKEKVNEEQVNEVLLWIILTGFTEFHNKYIGKEEYIKIQNDHLAVEKAYIFF
jgi:hypothetical protein